ncbi:MAG: hypothetical protein CVU43_19240 [Chloroflexi bacterium HGW-Chloroflexi-5]|jgi:hypothetical protein|nr:MAG: hypothetical protein CVU43_19240 [Chloroflexi bacterium HGW-Chloroflexi-5]
MIKKRLFYCLLSILILMAFSTTAPAEELFTPIADIIANPTVFANRFVSVYGHYSGWKNAPGSPPVSRSDWVLCDENNQAIYCTGAIPQDAETGAPETFWRPLSILAAVRVANGMPYLEVKQLRAIKPCVEKMVSVAQILFSPIEMQGQHVGLLGVLAKGYGVKGDRLYLLADPTGAIKLGRLPKLYPKGTILHIRGYVVSDENGLPMIDNVEIVSAKVN